ADRGDPSALELGQPLLEEAPLGVRVYEPERAIVGRACVLDAIEAPQQLSTRRVQVVVAVELEPVDKGERGLDLARLGHGGSLIELDDRGAGQAGELAVQGR